MSPIFSFVNRFINKVLSPFGIRIIKSNSSLFLSNKESKKNLSSNNLPRFVNIGSGGWTHPEWYNLDKPSDWYANAQKGKIDYPHDLMLYEKLPFERNSLEVIFCSHVIEHLPDRNVSHLFKEVFRVLKPGGFFRIICPDIELIYNAYSRKDTFFMSRFCFQKKYHSTPLSLEESFLHCFAGVLVKRHPYKEVKKIDREEIRKVFNTLSLEDGLNHFTSKIPLDSQEKYPAHHLNWFTSTKVLNMLKDSGFKETYISAFGQSRSPQMTDVRFFDKTQPWMSLYVECTKH